MQTVRERTSGAPVAGTQHAVRDAKRRWHERSRYLKAIKTFRAASKGAGPDSKNEFVESPRGHAP